MIELEAVLTSPYTRAAETARILAEAAGGVRVIESPALVTGDHQALLAAVRQAGVTRIAAVGHEPTISGAMAQLLTGASDAFEAPFKKGGAALLVYEDGLERLPFLAWFLTPAALRAIGRVEG